MLRVATLLSAAALLGADAVRASAVSHSVFPNSACAGAHSGALAGLVGIGKVTLSNGDVEAHCGCISDNLAEFELCPSSSAGQALCNSALDLKTNTFTASCDVEACSGAECTATVVNKIVFDEDECYNSEKGATGIVTIDGEAKCGCASDDADAFSPCAAPANGRALCVATDADFLGSAPNDVTKVECSVQCDEGFFLTPGGSCIQFAKRAHIGTSAPVKVGPSSSMPHHGTPTSMMHHPHHTPAHHPHHAHSSHPHHHSSVPSHPGSEMPPSWIHSHSTHGPSESTHGPSSTYVPSHSTHGPHHGHHSHHPHHAHPTSGGSHPTTTSYSFKHHHHHSSQPHGSATRQPWASVTSRAAAHHGTHRPLASWYAHTTDVPLVKRGYVAEPVLEKRAHVGTSRGPIKAGPSSSGSNSVPTTVPHHPHHAHPTSTEGVPSQPGSETPMPPSWIHSHSTHAPSHSTHVPSHSASWVQSHSMHGPHHGHHSHHPHQAHPTSGGPLPTTPSYSLKHHHHTRPHHGGPSSSMPMKVVPTPSTMPHHHHHSSRPVHSSGGPSTNGPSMPTTTTSNGPSTTTSHGPWATTHAPGASQLARRTEEFVFTDVCAQDERTCPVGSYGDFSCVRLDDVTECGGCNVSGDAKNCLEIEGASSVSCLRGGCVVRSCQTGFVQTSEGTCEPKA